MKKRPNLVLREPVKLYETKREVLTSESIPNEENPADNEVKFSQTQEILPEIIEKKEFKESEKKTKESVKDKLPPRIGQIWDYFCRKAKADGKLTPSFNLTRSEVMKEAGIGSTNTYRDALKRFQDLGLLEIELRPGVNSGSIFTLTEKGIEQID